MHWLENRIAPPDEPGNWKRDLLGVAFLAGLLAILFPSWMPAADVEGQRYLTDVLGQLGGPILLMAVGWLIALRNGAIDLSVWVVAGLAGVTAAAAISAGFPPLPAFIIATALGGFVGLINGLLVSLARIPSVAATLLVGVSVVLVGQAVFSNSPVHVPADTFHRWLIVAPFAGEASVDTEPETPDLTDNAAPVHPAPDSEDRPIYHVLTVTRVVIVLAAYFMAMFLAVGRRSMSGGRKSTGLVMSLTLCGLLAGLAGACRLMDHGFAAMPARLLGDLRVPTTAVLAGSWFFVGPNRAQLAGLCLPIALIVATIWRQQVWLLGTWGYEWQLLLLTGVTILYQLASRGLFAWTFRPRALAASASAAVALGTALLAAAPLLGAIGVRSVYRIAALALCATGGIALLQAYRFTRDRR